MSEDREPSREREALLGGFFTPHAPLAIRPWGEGASGGGVRVGAGAPPDLTDLAGTVTEPAPGLVRVSFDPEATVERLVTEGWASRRRPLHTYFPASSTLIPGRLREAMIRRTAKAGFRDPGAFPRWPAEPCVEEIRRLVFDCARRAGLAADPEPFWPGGKSWAAVLSHDLDAPEVYRRALWKPFAELEQIG